MEIGTGCNTILSQVVAEELGIPMENIRIAPIDTDQTPYDTSTTASRSTFMMGNAVRNAARNAREQILDLACRLLKVNRADLIVERGNFFVRNDPQKKLTWKQLAVKSLTIGEGQIIGKGSSLVPAKAFDVETAQGWETPWMYAAQAAEVEVDKETGFVKVLRIAAAHDVGKAINPDLCKGQIEGALITGIGTTLLEEMILKDGRVLNPNFHDYKLCTALDIPEINPILIEEAHPDGPYGAKGLGEPALAPTAAAIANAIYDAVGVRIKTLPLTPERVFMALKEKS
jgi:carbon-monoxide dehydrogenase large subunit